MTKSYCYYNLDQVRDSGLIPAVRMDAIAAEIESRIEKCYDVRGRVVDNCALAMFPSGQSWLYPRTNSDPKGDHIRRELLGEVLTPEELKLVNSSCLAGWNDVNDAKRFEKAEKLTEWDGWVTDGNRYWSSVGAYLDECGDDVEADEVTYVWVATHQTVVPHLSVNDVVGRWLTDRGWQDMDTDDLEGVKTLQAALDAFVVANAGVVSYTPDYGRAVLLEDYLEEVV